MKMQYKDRIYGKTTITSPLLVELINSEPLQRLKGIAQFGVPDEYYHIKGYDRFEHSVGVMLLLKKLGASEEEQVAGLLHDVSHTAFSHMIDWVLGSGLTEDFQDNQHKNIILTPGMSKVLKRYSYSPEKIADHHNYKLLETDIPNLCADRIDYAIREFPENTVYRCINALTVKDGKIVFKDKENTLLFAENFLIRQKIHWGGFEAVSRYHIFSIVLKKALDKKIIKMNDFWKDDRFIIDKLTQTEDCEIQQLLTVLRKKSLSHFPKSNKTVVKKFRYVNPEFISGGKLIRLSEADEEFKKLLETSRRENLQGISIPII